MSQTEKSEQYINKTLYKSQTWLNPLTSSSTGSVVCYDGTYKEPSCSFQSTFIQISDWYSKVKLHKTDYDSMEDFIVKLKLLREDISKFIEHLEQKKINNYGTKRKRTINIQSDDCADK